MTTTHLVSPVEFDDTEIEITGNAYHHLFRVKRMRAGEALRIVDGEGRARRAVVARVDRGRGVVALGSAEPSREPERRVELLVALPKPDRAAWLVEKATEIGVAAIRFVSTARSARDERAFQGSQQVRLRRVAIAAVEQCGRSVVPEIAGVDDLASRLGELGSEGVPRIVFDVEGDADPWSACAEIAGHRVAVCVGPEGGWSPEERRDLAATEGMVRVRLGDRVLRIETAAVVATALALFPRKGD